MKCSNFTRDSHVSFFVWFFRKVVLENGLQDGNRVLSVCLRCVVCDAPARALVKGIKLCSGYFGCNKCAQKGTWAGKVVYPLINDIDLQTDYSFRGQVDEGHHLGAFPFENYMQTSRDFASDRGKVILRVSLLQEWLFYRSHMTFTPDWSLNVYYVPGLLFHSH